MEVPAWSVWNPHVVVAGQPDPVAPPDCGIERRQGEHRGVVDVEQLDRPGADRADRALVGRCWRSRISCEGC